MHEYDEYNDPEGMGANSEATADRPGIRYSRESNTYPDPEDIPSYPWLGSGVIEEGPSIPTSSFSQLSAPCPLGFSEDESEGQNDILQEDIDTQRYPRMDENDLTVDPDFQYSDDSPTYVSRGTAMARGDKSNKPQKRQPSFRS